MQDCRKMKRAPRNVRKKSILYMNVHFEGFRPICLSVCQSRPRVHIMLAWGGPTGCQGELEDLSWGAGGPSLSRGNHRPLKPVRRPRYLCCHQLIRGVLHAWVGTGDYGWGWVWELIVGVLVFDFWFYLIKFLHHCVSTLRFQCQI